MKQTPQRSLAEMARDALGSGRVCCPKCACEHLDVYRTTQGQSSTFRYKACRNCGHRILTTTQTAERIVRDVSVDESSDKA